MENVIEVLTQYGELLVKNVKQRILKGNKVATGVLVNSIDLKYSFKNGQYNIQITGAKHLINVERGRRAGAKMPPIQPIINWIKVKRININNQQKYLFEKGPNKFKKKTRGRSREAAIKSAAFAMAKSISKKGIKPFPIFNIAQNMSNSNKFKTNLAKAMAKDTNKLLIDIWKKGGSK